MSTIRIGSINTTSAAIDNRIMELSRLAARKELDMVLIQETRLKGKTVQAAALGDYYLWREDEGVGTAILLSDKWRKKARRLEVPQLQVAKATGLAVKCSRGGSDLRIWSVYLPCQAARGDIVADLNALMGTGNDRTIIGGDFNTPNGSSQESSLFAFKAGRDNEVEIVEPAQATFARSCNKLDKFVCTNDINCDPTCRVLNIGLEHHLITHVFSINIRALPSSAPKRPLFGKTNWTAFKEACEERMTRQVPRDRNLTDQEIERWTAHITLSIRQAMEQTIPVGSPGRGPMATMPKEIDQYYAARRRIKRKLRREMQQGLPDERLIDYLKWECERLSTTIAQLIEYALNSSMKRQIELAERRQQGGRFKEIGRLLGKQRCFRQVRVKDDTGTELKDEDLLDELTGFYRDLYAERFPKCDQMKEVLQSASRPRCEPIKTFTANSPATIQDSNLFASAAEIFQIIKSIKPKTSAGEDQIPNVVIKQLPHGMIVEITVLINQCINTGYFPKAWKSSRIIPIPKKNGILEAKDFRPISLTSNLGKLLERVMQRRLNEEMDEGAIPPHQFGFRAGHSTTDALHLLTSKIQAGHDDGHYTAVALLDVKKAFDSVWTEGLLYKLERAGIKGANWELLRSFLKDRTARIVVGGRTSAEIPIQRGVPQGSINGPVLYNVYIGDLRVALKPTGTLLQYADDTAVAETTCFSKLSTRRIQEYCREIRVYYTNWGIQLNEGKTEYLVSKPPQTEHGPRRRQTRSSLVIGGAVIKPAEGVKYLGVHLDGAMSFKKQASVSKGKASAAIGMARSLLANKELAPEMRHGIYKLYIRPCFAYAAQIWATEEAIKELEKTERRAFRIIHGLTYDPGTGKQPNTAEVYKKSLTERFGDFCANVKDKHEGRRAAHPNPMMH